MKYRKSGMFKGCDSWISDDFDEPMEHDDCKFVGNDGWCELLFHEPDELKQMCPICKDYEPK